MEQERNILMVVSDQEIVTPLADTILKRNFFRLGRTETSSSETALKTIDAFRGEISMLLVLRIGKEEVLKNEDLLKDIPHVLFIESDIQKAEKRIMEPFDFLLSSWLIKLIHQRSISEKE